MPMKINRHLKALALAALATTWTARTAAAPVTYWFSGVVDGFQNASNTAPGGVTIGTPFVGRINYEPASVSYAYTNQAGGGSYSGYNFADTTAFSFTVYIAGHTISNTVFSNQSGQVGVYNNVSGRDDYFAETASTLVMNGTNMAAPPNQASLSLYLSDPSATAFTSTALPLIAPRLNQFDQGGYFVMSVRNGSGSVYLSSVAGPVTAISTNQIVQLNLRRASASTLQVAWPLYANGYTLQSTTNLANPNWQTVATAVVTTATEHTVTVTSTGGPKFFRLKK